MSEMKLNGSDEYYYRPETTLIVLADTIAKKHGLDPALVCALCEVGSGWNPWAIRYKPGDLCMDAVCVHEDWSSAETEQALQNYAFGLMQIKGNIARERGFDGWLTELCDPTVNLEWGCRHLRWMLDHPLDYGLSIAQGEIFARETALDLAAAWNGGKARVEKCSRCGGSGETSDIRWTCGYCHGTGGAYENQSYVDRVVRAMVNYEQEAKQ